MRLDEIKGATKNPKEHDIPGIKRSIAHHGMAAPLLYDNRTALLVGGHGTLQALRELHRDGRPAPKGTEVDEDGMWKVPVFQGYASRSDEDAAALLVALNKLSEKGGWFLPDLADVLQVLDEAGNLELAGYNLDELDDILAGLQETLPPAPPLGAAAGEGRPEPDDADELTGQMRRTRGLDELKDDYQASNVRLLVLSYPGTRYVWAVQQLAALSERYGVDTNADAVLVLIQELTGEQPPAA
uniref:hypothetical protein n=1 Tax=Pseudonocardia sp. CA-138482 TaxID=3240023 RepID=UPI003F496758